MPEHDDIIAAISTSPGRGGGIGILRLSGPAARTIASMTRLYRATAFSITEVTLYRF